LKPKSTDAVLILWRQCLACAHREAATGDDAKRLEQAVSLHLKALTVLTRSAFPQDHADAQVELAITRMRLSSRTNVDLREEIAQSLAVALEFYAQASFPCRSAEIRSETSARVA
jgi:hypothetical protein